MFRRPWHGLAQDCAVYSPSFPDCVRGAIKAQTVLLPSHLGILARDSPGRVSVLPSILSCPSLHLRAAQGPLPWTHPGRLSALSSCNSLAPFLPTGECRDINPPGNSGSIIPPPPSSCHVRTVSQTGGAQIVEGLAATGMQKRLSLGSAWPTHSQEDKQSQSAPGRDVAQVEE